MSGVSSKMLPSGGDYFKKATTFLNFQKESLEKNPLSVSVILTKFFQVCDTSDLPQLRLVCKSWYVESLPRCRNEMTVIIRKNVIMKRAPHQLHWGSYDNHLHADEEKPFHCYRLYDVIFKCQGSQFIPSEPLTLVPVASRNWDIKRDTTSFFDMQLEQFWVNFGGLIRKLELVKTEIFCVPAFERAIFHQTPNLEELKLTLLKTKSGNPPDDGDEDALQPQKKLKHLIVRLEDRLPITWGFLFRQFPNVETLEVSNFDSSEHSLAEFLEGCGSFEKRTHPKMVFKDFRFVVGTPEDIDSVKRILQLPQLTIKSFTFHIPEYGDEEIDLISLAIRLHGHTLKEVRVTVVNVALDSNAWTESFPYQQGIFPSLTKLELNGPLCWSIHFLEQFPNLKNLTLNPVNYRTMLQNTDFKRMAKLTMARLKFFYFTGDWTFLSIPREVFKAFAKVFPNLELFTANLENSLVRVFCQNFEKKGETKEEESGDDSEWEDISDDEDEENPPEKLSEELEQLRLRSAGKMPTDLLEMIPKGCKLKLPTICIELATEVNDETYWRLVQRFPNIEITRRGHPS